MIQPSNRWLASFDRNLLSSPLLCSKTKTLICALWARREIIYCRRCSFNRRIQCDCISFEKCFQIGIRDLEVRCQNLINRSINSRLWWHSCRQLPFFVCIIPNCIIYAKPIHRISVQPNFDIYHALNGSSHCIKRRLRWNKRRKSATIYAGYHLLDHPID